MKYLYIVMVISLLAAGCSDNGKKYDSYGNFESDEILISSEAAGKLLEFNIEEGTVLDAGFIAGIVDTVQLHLQKKQLESSISAIKSKYGNIIAKIKVLDEQEKIANVDLDRINKLIEGNAATQKQLDDIEGRISLINKQKQEINSQNNNIISEIKTMETRIEQVNDKIKRCLIVNPIKGTVLDKFAEQFEITAPGKPLYKIAKLDEITLRTYVSGAQLPYVKLGQKVKVFIDANDEEDKEYSGEVYHISSKAEFTPKIIQTKEERVNMVYAVKIRVKNDGSMKIGMPGAISFN